MSKKRTLTTAFNSDEENVDVVDNNFTITEDLKVISNNKNITKDVTPEENLLKQAKDDLKFLVESKRKRKTIEDTHKRATFLFRKDLSKKLDKLIEEEDGLTKTAFINLAIEVLLKEYKKK